MKKITKKWLKKINACCPESDMDRAEKEFKGDIELIAKALLDNNRFDDANWLLTRIMNKSQNVQYAIFAAEQVLSIFENKYPNDNRPRKAIEAAKNYLKNPCKKTKSAAYATVYTTVYAAANAATAAAYATVYATVYADANADAAATAHAAHAAAYAAVAYTKKGLQTKILEKGVEILKEKK